MNETTVFILALYIFGCVLSATIELCGYLGVPGIVTFVVTVAAVGATLHLLDAASDQAIRRSRKKDMYR